MAYRVGLHNFSKGVLSKELWGRADIAPYNAAVRIGTNVIILKYGGLTKRPGTRFAYEVRDGDKRLLPFQGALGSSYAMLFGQASMRLAALGGMVVEEESPGVHLTVEAVALTNPVQITGSYHGLTSGDEVFFSGVEGATWLNGRIETVTVTGPNTFTIPVDGTGLAARTGDTGGTIRVGAPPAPPAPPVVPPPVEPEPLPSLGGSGGGWWRFQNEGLIP